MTHDKKNTIVYFSIAKKLTIVFLILSIIPMSGVAYYNLSQGKTEFARLAESELIALSSSTARFIDQLLLENLRNSATLAGDPTIVKFLSASDKDRPPLKAETDEVLQNFVNNHPDYNAPGILDSRGIVLASLAEILVGKDRSFRDYFQISIKGKPFISDILVGRSTNKPGVFLTNPVKTSQGKILGINLIWLKADTIWEIIDDIQVGEKGISYLIDQDGVIIAHPNRDFLYHSLKKLSPKAISTISSTLRFGVITGTKDPIIPKSLGLDQLFDQIFSNKKIGTFRYYSPLDQQYHVVGYSPLKNQTWTILTDLPESQLLDKFHRLKNIAYISIGLVAIFIIIISILLARTITFPIRRLTDTATKVNSASPFDPLSIEDVTSGNDEIAYLGEALSKMVVSLQESEKNYRILIENAPDLRYRTDINGKIIFISQSVLRFTGRTVEETLGMKIADHYVDPSERGVFLTLLEKDGFVENFEAQLKHKDGTFWWASTNASYHKDQNGEIIGIEGVTRDITERKQSDEALKEKTNFLDQIIETSALSMWISDENGTAIKTNPACLEFFGATEEEIIGKYNLLQDSVIEKKGYMPTIKEVFEKGKSANFTIDYDFGAVDHVDVKNATHKVINTVLTPVLGNDKKVSNVIVQTIDLSEIKKAEEEKIQAQRHAAEQEKQALVGNVAGKIAHDFNNILGVVMGNTELALLDCKDDNTKKTLKLIFEQTLRGKNLTKNLVAFAKDQEPKQEFFKINEKIDLVINLLKKDLDSIKVIKEDSPNVPDLLADPGMMEHALVNIIQNSIHATSKIENPQITIRTYRLDEYIYFEIEDNGCGIPKEHLKSIYEPSFTLKGNRDVSKSYKDGVKGTGYGMANVKKYIDLHKGNLLVESVVESGTKFTISLPIIKKELTKEEITELREEVVHFKKNILLVEDEIAISDVQYKVLTQDPCNHIVDVANNGQIAIDLFNRNQYDLISLDYILPGGISGMDVYNHIRNKNKTIPILFISGNIEFLESIKALKQNDLYIDHLSKPCQNKDYISGINILFENNSA